MKKTHRNIPVFIPQEGCPNNCVFCSQRKITGIDRAAELDTLREEVGHALSEKDWEETEIAFFGGSFTAIDRGRMVSLLSAAYEYVRRGQVSGIRISTRPDCIDSAKLNYLQRLSQQVFVTVEYGIESTDDEVLRRINRGHDYACARKAVEETAAKGIITGAHLIVGLTEEDEKQCEMQARRISALPLDILKLHQLQIIKGTPLAMHYQKHPFHLYSVHEFIRLIGTYIAHLRPNIVLERFVSQSPKDLLLAPQWGLKNHEFTHLLVNYLNKQGIRQGMLHPTTTL